MKKIILREDEMPTSWYNVVPDIPGGLLPPLDPQTLKPIGPDKLSAVFLVMPAGGARRSGLVAAGETAGADDSP